MRAKGSTSAVATRMKKRVQLLARRLLATDSARTKVLAQLREAQQALYEAGCAHARTSTYQWEYDNGYGRQSMRTGSVCLDCGARKPWESSQSWDKGAY